MDYFYFFCLSKILSARIYTFWFWFRKNYKNLNCLFFQGIYFEHQECYLKIGSKRPSGIYKWIINDNNYYKWIGLMKAESNYSQKNFKKALKHLHKTVIVELPKTTTKLLKPIKQPDITT